MSTDILSRGPLVLSMLKMQTFPRQIFLPTLGPAYSPSLYCLREAAAAAMQWSNMIEQLNFSLDEEGKNLLLKIHIAHSFSYAQ